MSLSDFLDKTLTLDRRANTKDDIGTPVAGGFSTIASGVACCLWPASARTVSEFAKRDMVVDHQIVTTTDIGARANDRITIGGGHYIVKAYSAYDNATISSSPLYMAAAEKRNQT